METQAAAQALSLLNSPMEMAEVLYFMDKNTAAVLLAALEPELAAQITSEMLRE
jgi:flagellar motility protein MotE (MotC chaperone)